MGLEKLVLALKEAGLRLAVIMLALILVMIVASRSVEFDLEQSSMDPGIVQTTPVGN